MAPYKPADTFRTACKDLKPLEISNSYGSALKEGTFGVLQSPSLFLITKRRHLGPSLSHHSDCWADGRGVRRPCCTAGFSQAPPSETISCDSRAPFLWPFPAFSLASCKEKGGSLAATRKLQGVRCFRWTGVRPLLSAERHSVKTAKTRSCASSWRGLRGQGLREGL